MPRSPSGTIDKALQEALGPPAWVPAEDLNHYNSVLVLIRQEMQPRSIFEELQAQDYTEKLFERLRLKQLQAALIAGGSPLAMRQLIEEAALDDSLPAPTKRAVNRFRQTHHITDLVVEAHAFNLQRDGIEKIERMVAYRARERIEKDLRKRRSALSKKTEQSSNAESVVKLNNVPRRLGTA